MEALLNRIPHKPPALLIDEVVELDDLRVICAVSRQAPAFVADARLPAAIGLEVMAQAAAVWLCKQESGEGGGMLVQARNLVLYEDFLDLESGLLVEVEHLPPSSGTGLTRFSGMIRDATGETLVAGEFMLMIKST